MKTLEAKAKYNKQRNICASLTTKAKRNYFESLDLNNICDNKKFWATVGLTVKILPEVKMEYL